jgi:hypothetical protein
MLFFAIISAVFFIGIFIGSIIQILRQRRYDEIGHLYTSFDNVQPWQKGYDEGWNSAGESREYILECYEKLFGPQA